MALTSLQLYAVLGVIGFFVSRFVLRTYAIRRRFNALPGLPHSMLLGHLEAMDKFGFAKYYTHVSLDKIHQASGEDVFFLDTAPVVSGLCVLNTAELAEQVAASSLKYPFSVWKEPLYKTASPALGEKSIITLEDEQWRLMRKKFNPGFQPTHLHSLVPQIVEQTKTFLDILTKTAGKVVKIVDLTSALTVDIIGIVLFDQLLGAQSKEPELISSMQTVINWCPKTEEMNPFKRWHPLRPIILWYYTRKVDKIIGDLILQDNAASDTKSNRSIMALALKDFDGSSEQLTEAIDQVKSFFFAGHDTTSTTLAWVFYELSKHPEALSSLYVELDDVFGANRNGRRERSISLIEEAAESTMAKLVYTTACVKETLRLHPRASTFRYSPPGKNFTITHNGETYNVDDMSLCINQQSIQRDKRVYGQDANEFKPDRWLVPGFDPGKSYRPFETGYRNCIGQNLAMLEAKIILALTALEFKFQKVGYDGISEEEVYDIRTIVAHPVDGMRMRVDLRD